MALSGSVTSSAYSNRSVTLSWEATQSIAGNYSTVSWTLKGSGSASSWYNSAPFKVKINGESVFSSSTRIQLSNGTLVGSGKKTIYHNEYGQANLSIYIEAAIYTNAVNCSGSQTWALDNIPRAAKLNSAVDFTDEGNPTITYTNYLGSSVNTLQACISLTGAIDDIKYRDIPKGGSSYTFELTEEERNVLRNATTTSNSRNVIFFVKTVLNGVTYHSTLTKTLTIVNATPTFTSSVKDTGAASIALTGATAGNPSMIKGFNYMDVSMAATAYKGATIKTYKITNGANVINEASGAFNNSINNNFLFEVWDSRGNYNSYTTTIPMINYIPLTINADNAKILLDEADNTKARIEVELQGNYFNGSFGATTNSLSIDYSLEGDDGSKLTGVVEIPAAAFNGNTFTISFALDNLDYRNGYIVYFGAIDKVTPKVTVATKTLKAIPIFDWGENDFNFNVDVTFKGKSLVDLIYPVGSIYMSVNYFEPSTIFGGEWERLMDKFLLGSGAVYASGQEGGKSSVTLSAAIGATNSSTNALGYIAEGYTSYQAANSPTYTVYGASSANGGSWNHATPVTEHSSSSRDVSIMPPYLTVNMWKRVA